VIDLHTHILPGLDDGARSLDEAIMLCRHALADGTTTIVATPHSLPRDGLPGLRLRPDAVLNGMQHLQRALDDAGVAVRLLPGMEMTFEPDLAVRATRRLTLNHSRYLLLELPFSVVPAGTGELLFRLQVAGLVPVIAHPERNAVIAHQPALLYDFVSRGCLAQVTAGSLTGAFGRTVQAAAQVLVQSELAQIVASDAHWYPRRPTGLSQAVEVVTRLAGRERAEAMVVGAPKAILEDAPVTGYRPVLPRRRRWWQFWSGS
jgi:protein-tyrosine phosphatase